MQTDVLKDQAQRKADERERKVEEKRKAAEEAATSSAPFTLAPRNLIQNTKGFRQKAGDQHLVVLPRAIWIVVVSFG